MGEKIRCLLSYYTNGVNLGDYLLQYIDSSLAGYLGYKNPNIFLKDYTILYGDSTILTEKSTASVDIHKNPNLFFTAPDGKDGFIKRNIESGKLLIRHIKHYWNIAGKKNRPEKYDPTEGVESCYYLEDYSTTDSKGSRTGVSLKNCYLKNNVHHSYYIFCLHDEKIDKQEKLKFGENTYQVVDIIAFITNIYNELSKKFQSITNAKYIGSYVFFKKVDYSGKKIIKIPLKQYLLVRTFYLTIFMIPIEQQETFHLFLNPNT